MQKSLITASSQPLILSILANGESYGYAIMQKLHILSGGEMEWPEATLYPILKRMDRDGLIQSSWRLTDKGRPRKYYTLTDRGRQALEREQRHWIRITRMITSLCRAADVDPAPAPATE